MVDWLRKDNYEFFHDGNDLVFCENGIAKSFFNLPISLAEVLNDNLENRPLAKKSLDELKIFDPVQRLKKFTECNHGDFNDRADVVGDRINDCEYFNCGKRGECKHEGKLCNKIVAPNGVLSATEIRIIIQVAMDKSDNEIAVSMFRSRFTISTHIRNIVEKLGVRSRVGVALFAANKHLI